MVWKYGVEVENYLALFLYLPKLPISIKIEAKYFLSSVLDFLCELMEKMNCCHDTDMLFNAQILEIFTCNDQVEQILCYSSETSSDIHTNKVIFDLNFHQDFLPG